MNKHYINLAFDDKDAVKAQFPVKWDSAVKRWYAEDAAVAAAAQALTAELAGERDFAQREEAAAERNAERAAANAERQRVANALATLEVSPNVADLATAQKIVRQLSKSKFLLADDEKVFRRAFGPLASAMGIEYNTRNKHFKAAQVSTVISHAIALLA